MNKLYLLFFGTFFFTVFVTAQEPSESLRSAFQDGEYFFAREDFVDALVEYNTVYKRGFSENANLNYRMGICYLNIPDEKHNAIKYLEAAIHNVSVNHKEGVLRETSAPIDAFLYMGDAYRVNNKLDKAILSYSEFLDLYPEADNINTEYAQMQIQACNVAKEMLSRPVGLEKHNLGPNINTGSSNFAAVESGDGSVLIYMNELPFYTGVFMSTLQEDSTWSEPVNLTPQIQSDGDQSVASLSYNADQLYMVQEGLFDSDIRVSLRKEDGTWAPSLPLGKNINTKFWESHACVTKDGQTLYFTSNRKESLGEMDIFKANWNEEGYWDEPVNIGPQINTRFNEDFPFLSSDGERLYFSSQGHGSMGGFDLFYATKNDSTGVFENPVNVGYPINTTDDDNFYFPLGDGEYGLKALVEEDGYGKEDIYKIRIIDIDEAATMIAANVENDVEEEVEIQEQTEEAEASAEPEVITEPETIQEPVKPAVEFAVNTILFGFDSYALTSGMKSDLDRYKKLLELLSENSSVKITGHTDNTGEDEYNLRLSDKRANSVKQYLLSLGFDEDRIYVAGMGEKQPAADNTTREGRGANRRVEVDITGVDQTKLIIKK